MLTDPAVPVLDNCVDIFLSQCEHIYPFPFVCTEHIIYYLFAFLGIRIGTKVGRSMVSGQTRTLER